MLFKEKSIKIYTYVLKSLRNMFSALYVTIKRENNVSNLKIKNKKICFFNIFCIDFTFPHFFFQNIVT